MVGRKERNTVFRDQYILDTNLDRRDNIQNEKEKKNQEKLNTSEEIIENDNTLMQDEDIWYLNEPKKYKKTIPHEIKKPSNSVIYNNKRVVRNKSSNITSDKTLENPKNNYSKKISNLSNSIRVNNNNYLEIGNSKIILNSSIQKNDNTRRQSISIKPKKDFPEDNMRKRKHSEKLKTIVIVKPKNFINNNKTINNENKNEDDEVKKIISNLEINTKNKNGVRNTIPPENKTLFAFDDEADYNESSMANSENNNSEDVLYYFNEFHFNSGQQKTSEKDFDDLLNSKFLQNKIELSNLLLALPERDWYKESIFLSEFLKTKREQKENSHFFNEYLNKLIKLYNHFNYIVWALSYFYCNALLFNKKNWFKNKNINLPSHNSLEWIKGFEWKGLHIRILTYEKAKKIIREIKALKYILLDYLSIINNTQNNYINYKNKKSLLTNEIIFPFMSYSYFGGIVLYVSVEIKKLFNQQSKEFFGDTPNFLMDSDHEQFLKTLLRQSLTKKFSISLKESNEEHILEDDISFDENLVKENIDLSNYSLFDIENSKILHKINEKNLIKIFDDFNSVDDFKSPKFKFILVNTYSLLPNLFNEEDAKSQRSHMEFIDIKTQFPTPRTFNLVNNNPDDTKNEIILLCHLIQKKTERKNLGIYENKCDGIRYKIIYDTQKGNKIGEQVTKFFVQFPLNQNKELAQEMLTQFLYVGDLNIIINKFNIENTQEIPDNNIIFYKTSLEVKMKYSLLTNKNISNISNANKNNYLVFFQQICKFLSENINQIRNIDNLKSICDKHGLNMKLIAFCLGYITDKHLIDVIQIYLFTNIIKKFYNYHEGYNLLIKIAIYERCKDEVILNSNEDIKDNNIIEIQKQLIVDIIKLILIPVESLKDSDPKKPFSKFFFEEISFFIFLKTLKIKNLGKYIGFPDIFSNFEIKQIINSFIDACRQNPLLFIDSLEKMLNVRMNPFIKYSVSIDKNNIKNIKKDDIGIFTPKINSFVDNNAISGFIFTKIIDIPSQNNTVYALPVISKIKFDNFIPNLIFKNSINYMNYSLINNQYYIDDYENLNIFKNEIEEIFKDIISYDGVTELIIFKANICKIFELIFYKRDFTTAKKIMKIIKTKFITQNLFTFSQYAVLYLLDAILEKNNFEQQEELFSKSLMLALLNLGDVRGENCIIHQFLMYPVYQLMKSIQIHQNSYINEYFAELKNFLEIKITQKFPKKNLSDFSYYKFSYEPVKQNQNLKSSINSTQNELNNSISWCLNDENFIGFICNTIIDYFYSVDNLVYDDDFLTYNNLDIKCRENNLFNNKDNNGEINNKHDYLSEYIFTFLLDKMSFQKYAPTDIIISFGDNKYNQVTSENTSNIVNPSLIYPLFGKKINQIFCGYNYNFVVDKNEKIFSWGYNIDGQCGIIVNNKIIKSPTEVKIGDLEKNEKINKIICGDKSTYFISNKNKIFLCGYSALTHEKYIMPRRIKIFFEKEKIIQISSGQIYTLFLTQWGNVYSILNDYNANNSNSQIKVSNISNIQMISCGYNHCFAITKNNIVFCWGMNDKGQLGLKFCKDSKFKEKNYQIKLPQKLNIIGNIKNIYCGNDFTIFHNDKNELLSCGNNEKCQLGIFENENDNKCHHFISPTEIEQFYNMKILKVACGSNNCIAIVEDVITRLINVWSWGNNDFGQLGLGFNVEKSTPKPIPYLMGFINHMPKAISAGANHCLILLVRKDAYDISEEKILNELVDKYAKF